MTRPRLVPSALLVAGVLVGGGGCPGNGDHSGKRTNGSGSAAGSGSGSAVDVADLPVLPPAPPLPAPPAALPPLPADAPTAKATPEAVALGELLFFDDRLASDASVSCASCHDPDHDWSGSAGQTSAGGKVFPRRAPALTDVAWRTNLGWDGRTTTLDRHMSFHFKGQMGDDPANAITRIAGLALYRAHFQRAYGAPPDGGRMLDALAAFVATRYSAPAPWDAEEHGAAPTKDKAGTATARGYLLFTGKAQCGTCHPPSLYTDQDYHRLGLVTSNDTGRGAIDPDERGAFKTPTLRGAALRKAFFHDGSVTSLDGAIDWHLAGGTGQGADRSIVDLPPVTLTPAERADLGAFVAALSPKAPAPYARPLRPQ
jgi:cytochrome c peroxidase